MQEDKRRKTEDLYPIDNLHLITYLETLDIHHVDFRINGATVFFLYRMNAELKAAVERFIFNQAVVNPRTFVTSVNKMREVMFEYAGRGR